jgi:hypothetical protein
MPVPQLPSKFFAGMSLNGDLPRMSLGSRLIPSISFIETERPFWTLRLRKLIPLITVLGRGHVAAFVLLDFYSEGLVWPKTVIRTPNVNARH